jgi:prepilin-type processing-associated H-X9-DG protein
VRQKRTGKLILFVVLIGAGLTIGVRGMVRGWELQRRLACAEQMKRIGAALKVYGDADGEDLAHLVNMGAIRREDLICPASRQTNYAVAPGSGELLLTEPLSNHLEGANVLFPDGHVSFVLREDWEKLRSN